MERSSQEGLRNLGIVAHIDAGKTSLTERILFLSGAIRDPGFVDAGTTTTDFLPVERERGITVKAACVRLGWKGRLLNLIDTPGHVDFGAEVERSLRVLDSVVVVLCAVAGVQARTEAVLRVASRRGLPRLAFVNKLDRRGASFARAAAELKALEPGLATLALPLGEGPEFRGVMDLVAMAFHPAVAESAVPGAAASEAALPEAFLQAAAAARESLVEAVAEADDEVLSRFAEGESVGPDLLAPAIRRATVAGRLVPLLCGSAFCDPTVACLLDAMADYLPSPPESSCPEGVEAGTGLSVRPLPRAEEPFSAFVFRTQNDESFGRLSWVRVWSGKLAPGDRILDATGSLPLRVQKIFAIQAQALSELPSAQAGDIAALAFAGPKGGQAPAGRTGASLGAAGRVLAFESLSLAPPVLSLALEPQAQADAARLEEALGGLLEEDPSLRLQDDAETGRRVLAGMGELHLEVALERLRREWGLRLKVGQPRVSYREALKGRAEAQVDLDRAMNGERVRASLTLAVEPGPSGSGASLALGPGLKMAKPLQEACLRGLEAAASAGPTAGWPLEDWRATLLGASLPGGRQDVLVMEMAASQAGREALARAGTQVLEPWMWVDLTCPEDCLGSAMALLASRGGRVESVDDAGSEKRVGATAPLRLLFGLATELRSATEGRGGCEAKFLRYEALRGEARA